MAQFYTLLERAVRGLQPNTEGARQEIYARARSAVVEELRAIDPPLAPAERMRREQELEEAIRNVEREYGSGRGASGAVAIPATASTAALDGDRTGRAARHDPAGDEPGLDSAIPPRSNSSRLLLLALLALVVAGASYAAYTYRVGLQDFFASLTGGNEPTESTVAAADAGVGGDVEALAPVAVAAVIPTQSFLYEDLGTGDALAIEGTVAWALVNDPDGTRIEVRIDIPARGLQVVLSMQEADGTIGVSHTLDVLVTTPPNDGGRAVQSIARTNTNSTPARPATHRSESLLFTCSPYTGCARKFRGAPHRLATADLQQALSRGGDGRAVAGLCPVPRKCFTSVPHQRWSSQ